MLSPPGWFPDPMGAPHLRWFDGAAWSDWISSAGQVVSSPLRPAATGGGTLVTEPVLWTTSEDGGTWTVTTPAGQCLARAHDVDGQRRRLEVHDPSGLLVLRLRRAGVGSSATVAVRLPSADASAEVGRYEAARGAVRLLARAALVASGPVPAVDQGVVTLTDPTPRPVARLERRRDVWQTELARPLGDPLHPLVALLPLAVVLLEGEAAATGATGGLRPSS